jgi:hypothetical protein
MIKVEKNIVENRKKKEKSDSRKRKWRINGRSTNIPVGNKDLTPTYLRTTKTKRKEL